MITFRYLLIKWKIRRYFKKDENDRHIHHYIKHCSQGDWLVLYQMSRNMNKRFFADFISVLSRTVNPHDEDECNELEHFQHHHHNTDYSDEENMVSFMSFIKVMMLKQNRVVCSKNFRTQNSCFKSSEWQIVQFYVTDKVLSQCEEEEDEPH